VGYPRFPAPVEFIAAVIAYYVHPVNIQTACLIMEGAEFTENIINGVERPVKAAELFAFTLRVQIGRAVQQECRDRSRMPSSARKKKTERLPQKHCAAVLQLRICWLPLTSRHPSTSLSRSTSDA